MKRKHSYEHPNRRIAREMTAGIFDRVIKKRRLMSRSNTISDDWLRERSPISLLMQAAYSGNLEVIKQLHAGGYRLDQRDPHGRTAVMFAAAHKNDGSNNKYRDVILYLCRVGKVNVNAVDVSGKTALMRAAENGNLPIVVALEMCGAQPDARDIYGKTALMYAAEHGHNEVIRSGSLFMHSKRMTEIKDIYGQTAANHAKKHGRLATVALLAKFR